MLHVYSNGTHHYLRVSTITAMEMFDTIGILRHFTDGSTAVLYSTNTSTVLLVVVQVFRVQWYVLTVQDSTGTWYSCTVHICIHHIAVRVLCEA